ncbi:MAG TPA: AfsA-related hotdog domain-containing protein [Micromonosporaceae bacterium]
MITPQLDSAPPTDAARMRFARTVDRDLVHKWSLTEVFLTDYAAVDDRRYLTAAQLPVTHGYFNDHAAACEVVDPLLILEVARQVATYGAHAHSGVPRSAVLILSSYRLDLVEPVPLDRAARPAELVASASVTEQRTRAGRPTTLSFEMRLSMSDHVVATVDMAVTAMAGDQYHALRVMRRGGEPPTAFDGIGEVGGDRVDPALVRRFNPANVVIRGVTATGDGTSALLDPGCYANRSMFDHPYDHVPAMVLTEAARQVTVIGADVDTAAIRGLSGRFAAFAELDSAVRVSTAARGGAGRIEVTATQHDRTVADIAIVVD